MFGIGLPELILILIVALLVVGPKKLPELARSLGKALHDVKSMTEDVKQTFVGDIDLEADLNKDEGKITPGTTEESQTHKKDDKAAEPDIGQHTPDNTKSDPHGNLRG